MQYTKKCLVILVILAVSACTNAPNTPPKDNDIATAPAVTTAMIHTPTALQTESLSGDNTAPPLQSSEQNRQNDVACVVLGTCLSHRVIEPSSTATNTSTTFEPNTQTDSSTSGNSIGNTKGTTQIINSPNQNVILTQLPANNTIQSFNKIDTATIKTPTANLVQQAVVKDAEFNQLSTSDSINAVNGVISNNKTLNGSVEQTFSFKSIEMIQHNSVGSIHAVNYMGDPIPKR
ncbi:MAG: hypothetical protein JG718_15475 [Candidatus Thiothrix moscowensis]|nr:hypothetical protein [Candidatus Thiothrix moscowensis]